MSHPQKNNGRAHPRTYTGRAHPLVILLKKRAARAGCRGTTGGPTLIGKKGGAPPLNNKRGPNLTLY